MMKPADSVSGLEKGRINLDTACLVEGFFF
jgi:hypothetical protein